MPSLLHGQAEAGGYRWPGRALRAPLRAPRQEVATERLDQLRGSKLRALVSKHLDKGSAERAIPSVLPGGAALFDPETLTAYVLIDDGAVARFGAALAWADRNSASFLNVLVDGSPSAPGIVARRAGCFDPAPAVWTVSGTSLEPAVPAGPVADIGPSPDPELVSLLSSRGLEVVHEHGVLRGEVLGLEVARTVGERLEVGVGRHDRSARVEMRPGEDPAAALTEAAEAVRAHRRRDVPRHPANTLARSRWLRAVVCGSPARFGFGKLDPVAPPLPWFDLTEAGAAPCAGELQDGTPAVVVCSVGADLDLIPTAADCWLLYGRPESQLWLVLPEGDDLPVTRRLATRLSRPAQVLVVGRDWDSDPEL